MTKQITLSIETAREMLGKDLAMDQLIRANFSEDELKPKPKYPKRYEDLETIDGWYIDDVSDLEYISDRACDVNKNVFDTKQQALSFGKIYPQLTKLMKVYRGGWEPDWNDVKMAKYSIIKDGDDIRIATYTQVLFPISFQSHDLAQQFLTDHRDLITEFYKGM